MRKLFGTDGIRGTANREPMTAHTALHVAMAAAAEFRRGDHLHRVLIGKDTRLSGYMIESALVAGFTAMGMDVLQVGPMPTPAVAMLTTSLRADLGVMISASHNPYRDNGIKLFGPDGRKLSDSAEASIERRIERNGRGLRDLPDAGTPGRAKRLDDAPGRYIEFVKQTFPRGLTLDGLKIVVDCANGAAYKVAPTVLAELGAEVVPFAVAPNGRNINDGCGATATEAVRERVVRESADLGIALDGDADRLILADEKGARVDGDHLMALIATSWARAGALRGGALVATVMSNLGLERFLTGAGIGMIRTAVGDRHVIEAMLRDGVNVGGEQSGHIILSDHLTTGDGLVAALQVLAALRRTGRPASETCRLFEPLPQFLKNVRVEDPETVLSSPAFARAAQAAEAALAGTGRLLVRKSGTEPLIRVMAEGEDEALALDIVDGLIARIETMRNGAAVAR